jgi:branched-chain amino acid transport system substrate-binding protein
MPAKARRLFTPVLIALLIVAGCAAQDPGSSDRRVVKIGFIGPLTGPQRDFGLGARNSVALAVRQANQRRAIPGWTIELVPIDDLAEPAMGKIAARQFAADPQVAGVIGPMNSGVAKETVPVLGERDIVQISPSNTDPTLTLGPYPIDAPRRVWRNYFRIVASSLGQGRFAANYAYDRLRLRSAATVHDKKGYGQSLVTVFERRWRQRGGRVTSSNAIDAGDRQFSRLAARLAAQDPDIVFYGGEYPEAGWLLTQLKQRGFDGTMIGGDGLYSDEMIKRAGRAGEGTMAASVGAPAGKLPSAAGFIQAYAEGGFAPQDFSAFGPQAYDSANILIAALARVLPESDGVAATRRDVVRAVDLTRSFKGATGEHAFDQFGDTRNTMLTMYRIRRGAWRDVFTGLALE